MICPDRYASRRLRYTLVKVNTDPDNPQEVANDGRIEKQPHLLGDERNKLQHLTPKPRRSLPKPLTVTEISWRQSLQSRKPICISRSAIRPPMRWRGMVNEEQKSILQGCLPMKAEFAVVQVLYGITGTNDQIINRCFPKNRNNGQRSVLKVLVRF